MPKFRVGCATSFACPDSAMGSCFWAETEADAGPQVPLTHRNWVRLDPGIRFQAQPRTSDPGARTRPDPVESHRHSTRGWVGAGWVG